MGTDFYKSKKTKYVLLYGVSNAGKTLLLYNMQSSFESIKSIQPTKGYNYEEETKNSLGIFDVSGDPEQYEVVEIILKSIDISGIIFVVPLDNLTEFDKSKHLLQLVLANSYMTPDLPLFIIYNEKSDNLNWKEVESLDSILFPEINRTKLKISKLITLKLNIGKLSKKREEFDKKLEEFIADFNKY